MHPNPFQSSDKDFEPQNIFRKDSRTERAQNHSNTPDFTVPYPDLNGVFCNPSNSLWDPGLHNSYTAFGQGYQYPDYQGNFLYPTYPASYQGQDFQQFYYPGGSVYQNYDPFQAFQQQPLTPEQCSSMFMAQGSNPYPDPFTRNTSSKPLRTDRKSSTPKANKKVPLSKGHGNRSKENIPSDKHSEASRAKSSDEGKESKKATESNIFEVLEKGNKKDEEKEERQERNLSSAYHEEAHSATLNNTEDPTDPSLENNPKEPEGSAKEGLLEVKQEPDSVLEDDDDIQVISAHIVKSKKKLSAKDRNGLPDLKLPTRISEYFKIRRRLYEKKGYPMKCSFPNCPTPEGKAGHFRWKKQTRNAVFLVDAHCTKPLYLCQLCINIKDKRRRFSAASLPIHFENNHPGREVKMNAVSRCVRFSDDLIALIEECLPLPNDVQVSARVELKLLEKELDDEDEEDESEKEEETSSPPTKKRKSEVEEPVKGGDSEEIEVLKSTSRPSKTASTEDEASAYKKKLNDIAISLKAPKGLSEAMDKLIDEYLRLKFSSMKCRGMNVGKKNSESCPKMFSIGDSDLMCKPRIKTHVMHHYEGSVYKCNLPGCGKEVRWIKKHYEKEHVGAELNYTNLVDSHDKELQDLAASLFPQPTSLLQKVSGA